MKKTRRMPLSEKVKPMRFVSTLLAALLALAAGATQAQDPPGRVGRLAHTEGAVSVYTDPEFGWEPAYVNTPITSENSVWTDQDSRAEVRVGPMAIRLDETTQLDVAALDDGGLHATLVRGAVNVRVRHFLPNDRIEIDTPQARFVLLAEGRYRIDADPERGDSRLTVFSGRAALQGGRGQVAVGVGSSVVVWGEGRSSYAMQRAFTTPFDTWASSLDSRWVERASTQYVSTSMTGYEDLDRYGQWIQEPDYGPLWVPTRVASSWVPYRDGHWAWVRPWGWTWVDDQPWGYAPFHYGRWVYVRDRWAWYPGQRVEHPVWAPALVAWVGGANFSVGVRTSSPVVGWYPLSPFETYRPWYRANTTYVNNINIVTIRDNHRASRYAERQRDIIRERASTVVQSDALLSRRNVRQAMVQVAPEVIRREQPVQQPTAVLPTRNDVVRARTERSQPAATASAPASGSTIARSGSTASAGTPPGVAPAAPVIQPPSQRPSFARQQAAPAPQAAPANATPPPAQAVSRAVPPGQANSRFGPGAQPPAPGMPPSAKGQEAIERRDTRALERDQQKAQQDQQRAQQEQQKAQQDQQRAQQEQQQRQQAEQQRAQDQQRQQQEKAARDSQQQQQQQQRAQQEQQQAPAGRSSSASNRRRPRVIHSSSNSSSNAPSRSSSNASRPSSNASRPSSSASSRRKPRAMRSNSSSSNARSRSSNNASRPSSNASSRRRPRVMRSNNSSSARSRSSSNANRRSSNANRRSSNASRPSSNASSRRRPRVTHSNSSNAPSRRRPRAMRSSNRAASRRQRSRRRPRNLPPRSRRQRAARRLRKRRTKRRRRRRRARAAGVNRRGHGDAGCWPASPLLEAPAEAEEVHHHLRREVAAEDDPRDERECADDPEHEQRLAGARAHRASAGSARTMGRSLIGQHTSAAKMPRPIEIHHARS
jgi:hypothetical protein